jgi:hypothetical protein
VSRLLSSGGARKRLQGLCGLSLFLLGAGLTGCGGGGPNGANDFVESLVRLLSARFVPATMNVPRGGTRTVDLEIVCDRGGLQTVFGRLALQVKLDPERSLPPGLSATLSRPLDPAGFALFPCEGTHPDPELRIAHVEVRLQTQASAPVMSATLVALVQVEPLIAGEASKDSTRANLTVTVPAGEGTSPGN